MPIDMRTVPPPAKRGTRSSASRTPTVIEPEKTLAERRAEGLIGWGQVGQGVCTMVGLYADAATIGIHFPPLATEVAKLADSNDYIAKGVDFLIAAGPYTALIAAALPFALQMAANHGIIDASRMAGQGVVPPQVLDAQMRAQLAEMQAKALMAQKAAIKAAQEAQKEMEDMMREAQAA